MFSTWVRPMKATTFPFRVFEGLGDTWAQLRRGRWEDVLADVRQVDALITDTPYSERTHRGHNSAVAANRVRPCDEHRLRVDKRRGSTYGVGINRRRALHYKCWTPADVDAFVDAWSPRTRGWFVVMTDHVLAPAWMSALERHGRYVFSPLSFVHPGSRVRLVGDGPAQWAVHIVVARPRTAAFAKWGALPGGYVLPPGQPREKGVVGGKPLWLMRQLVRDYSRPGDLVCDPCAGGATTLRAALLEGRDAIGAERLQANYRHALTRLSETCSTLLEAAE